MFSVPLGILFGADVCPIPPPSFPTSPTYVLLLLSQLTVNEYIRKSLIASLIGNIIGALFVAIPACYFWLGDWDYHAEVALKNLEGGEVMNQQLAGTAIGSSSASMNGEKPTEVYRSPVKTE